MGFIDSIKNLFKKNKDVQVETPKNDESVEKIEQNNEDVTVESLAYEQKLIDDLYEAEGLTDKVLDMQVALNEKRNKYNISDKNNLNEDGWSQ